MKQEKISLAIVDDHQIVIDGLKSLLQGHPNFIVKIESTHPEKMEGILAVNKVQQQLINTDIINRNKVIVENYKNPNTESQQIILPTLEGFEVAKVKDIIRLKGNGNFTDIYFTDGSKKMICRFLKHFDDLLDAPFIRVHKSHIINLNFVKSYNKGGYATLTDNSDIEISSTYKNDFLTKFGK